MRIRIGVFFNISVQADPVPVSLRTRNILLDRYFDFFDVPVQNRLQQDTAEFLPFLIPKHH